jgi:hypothetical protein
VKRLLLLALLLAVPAAAQDYSGAALGVEIQPAEIKVGDRAVATLTLVWEGELPQSDPRFPTWQKEWGEAEVVGAGPVQGMPSQGGRRIYRQEVTITAFRPGTLELPPPKVVIPLAGRSVDAVAKGPARLLVGSVLPGEKSAEAAELEAKGPAGLVPAVLPLLPFLATSGLLAAALLLAGSRLASKIARQGAAAPAPPRDALAELPPHEEFLRRLQAIDPGQGERAFTALSFALRLFLGRMLGVKALESTTTEIQRLLRSLLPVGVAQETVALLRECDRVKFARLEVDAATTSQRLEQGRHLARQVFERLRPEAPPAAAPAPAAAAGGRK